MKETEDAPLIGQSDVCRYIGVSVRTWRRWRAAGLVPAPVPNIPGRPRWRLTAIESFKRGLFGARGRRFFGSVLRSA